LVVGLVLLLNSFLFCKCGRSLLILDRFKISLSPLVNFTKYTQFTLEYWICGYFFFASHQRQKFDDKNIFGKSRWQSNAISEKASGVEVRSRPKLSRVVPLFDQQ